MAVVAGGHPAVGVPGVAGGLADGGVFVLTKAVGRDEFDEWYLAAPVGVLNRWIIYTTQDDPPYQFTFKLLELKIASPDEGGFVMMNGIGPGRTPSQGVGALDVNYICNPADFQIWTPTAPDQAAIKTRAGITQLWCALPWNREDLLDW
jgi:hypothetical protein